MIEHNLLLSFGRCFNEILIHVSQFEVCVFLKNPVAMCLRCKPKSRFISTREERYLYCIYKGITVINLHSIATPPEHRSITKLYGGDPRHDLVTLLPYLLRTSPPYCLLFGTSFQMMSLENTRFFFIRTWCNSITS